MPVEVWLQILTQIGGLGAMCVILLKLHRENIINFQGQLESERRANRELWNSYMDMKLRQHEQLIHALTAQDRVLVRILDRLRSQPCQFGKQDEDEDT